jgi:hypothetical protein
VLSIIEEYQYRDKFFSISFDNASNYNAAIRLLTNTLKPIMDGAFFHTKCAYHILNLIVKAGMEVDPIQNLIDTTRLKHGMPDTACLLLSFFGTARHDTKRNKIIKDTVRYGTKARRIRTQHSPTRHEFRTLTVGLPTSSRYFFFFFFFCKSSFGAGLANLGEVYLKFLFAKYLILYYSSII